MRPTKQTLTAEYVRSLLDYSPETGIFIRKVGQPRFVGRPAGMTHRTGYRVIKINQRQHLAHRLAWLCHYGEWPGEFLVDHVNGDKLDNRVCNLRKATFAQNFENSKSHNSENGFRGVQREKRTKKKDKWFATIKIGGKTKYLGVCASAEEASQRYEAARRDLYGEFAPND